MNPPASASHAFGAALRRKLSRYAVLARRHWVMLAVIIAMTAAWQVWLLRRAPGMPRSSSAGQVTPGTASSTDPASPEGVVSVAPAADPAPSRHNRIGKHLLLGLLIALVACGLALLLLDRFDDRLASSTEMIERFAEPVLAQIPNVGHTRRGVVLPLIECEDERYSYAEAFRSLRSSLIFLPNPNEVKTLGITSALGNEGKSTVASNLAITMASAGARVLLVDADLRRGDLAVLFAAKAAGGLVNILHGETSWRDALQTTAVESLSLITRGSLTDSEAELWQRPIPETLVAEFKKDFDTVIFNTAPVFGAHDATKLAAQCDGVIIVVRAQVTSARSTRTALASLRQNGAKILGLVLNSVDPETPDYYYYQYPKQRAT
jgi:capsular exopolysaccharide synthesis family protein